MTLTDYLRAFRRSWLAIAAMVLLGAIAAAGITVLLPRTYVARATDFVSITDAGAKANSLYQSSQFALDRVASYTELADGYSVLEPVITQLRLPMTVDELASHISASNPADTVVLTVQADGSKPEQIQRIANAVAAQLGKEIESLETPRAGGASPVKVTVAVPAGLPSAPVSPRPVLNLLIGLLAGLAVGAAIAIVREQMDTSVKSTDELHELAGVPPLGSFAEDASAKQPLVAVRHDYVDAEAFRSIRTSLQFANPDGPPRQVVVTSATSGEGTTVTACNLAIAMAQTSRRVCLVEGNIRRPMVGRYLGLESSVGLTDVVTGRQPITNALASWKEDQLTILQAGTTASPDPSQLLGSPEMANLLTALSERFDMVIIDAPPLLPVSDSVVLAHGSDGAILVARYGHTKRDDFSAAVDELQAVNARIIGTILTRVPPPRKRGRNARIRAYDQRHQVAHVHKQQQEGAHVHDEHDVDALSDQDDKRSFPVSVGRAG